MPEETGLPDTVPALLRERNELSPDAVAFSYEAHGGWRNITWGEFWVRTQRLAAALRAMGLETGEHVGILAPTGLGWELFHHAILAAGGVVVGLEPHDTPERLQWIANHAALRMLVVGDDELLEKLPREQTALYRGVIALQPPRGDRIGSGTLVWADLENEQAAAPSALRSITPAMPATLIYTSGTTGQPKGILFRHDQAVLAVRAITNAYPSFSVGSRFVCWLPLSNLFQRIMNLAAMKVGGRVFLVSNPLTVLEALPVAQPDVFIGVPRFYEKLYDGIQHEIARKPKVLQAVIRAAVTVGDRIASAERANRHSSVLLHLLHRLADATVLRTLRAVMGGRIKFMVTGSAPTPIRLLEFFHAVGLPLYEAYGMSENIVPMALNRPGSFRLGTVGKPLPENDVRLADDRELLVRGQGVFAGYHHDPRADLFTPDGYYRTGDYADFDAEGFLRLSGRKSEIIKTSTGRRISPVAVEQLLEEVKGVDRVAVVGSGRKCIVAIVTLDADPACGSALDSTARSHLVAAVTETCKRLPAHEQPAGFLVLAKPFALATGDLTPNLKLKRQAIEDRLQGELEALYQLIETGTPGRACWHFA